MFSNHDVLAIKLLRACYVAGIRVPEDLAIASFDDIMSAASVYPALTTIREPDVEMGERAAEILFQHIEGKLKIIHDEKMICLDLIRATD